jgi:prophage regulatory protein
MKKPEPQSPHGPVVRKRRKLEASTALKAPPSQHGDRGGSDDDGDSDAARAQYLASISKPKPPRFIYRNELLARVGVTYTSIWLWVRDGKFPAPRELGGGHQRGRLAWLESEIDEWMNSRPKRLPKGHKSREVA